MFPGNVGIGVSNPSHTFGLGSNVYIEGSIFVSGSVTAGNYNSSNTPSVYTSLIFYNNANLNSDKLILTNDISYPNRVLYEFTLSPGRYIINGNIPYKNEDGFVALDTVNWATVGLYNTSASLYDSNSTAIRIHQVTSIGSSYISDIECISYYWFIDVSSINTETYVIAINGKGHNLRFGPTGTNPTTIIIPVRGIGYDDTISVKQSIQPKPVKYNEVLSENTYSFTLSNEGMFIASNSNVDLYMNGQKQNYNNYTITTNTVNSITSYLLTFVNPATYIPDGTLTEIIVWPQYAPTSISSYYSSGYIYQQINTYTTPFLNIINTSNSSVRLGGDLVIDGNIYIQGNSYSGCNTSIFQSGVGYTGVPPLDVASNTIGTTNIIDGAVTVSKLNLRTGNVGIGSGIINSLYTLEVNGTLRSSNLDLYPNYNTNSIIGLPKELIIVCSAQGVTFGTGTLATIRATSGWNLYKVRANLGNAGSTSTSINIRVDGTSIFTGTNFLIINSGSKTSKGSTNYIFTNNIITINDDSEILISVVNSGTSASGLKVILYYTIRD
jgi:hypothetical protein